MGMTISSRMEFDLDDLEAFLRKASRNVPGVVMFCAPSVLMFNLFHISQHKRRWHNPKEQGIIVLLLLIPPVQALVSFLQYEITHPLFIILDSFKECYTALIFPLFLSLLYTSLQLNDDTLSSIYVRLKIGSRRISNIFPVTLIQPESVPINLSDLKFFEYSAWQFVAIRLVCSLFMILLQILGLYPPLWLRCVFFLVLNLSFLSALYTVYVFYHAFYDDFRLRQHGAYFFFRSIIFTCFFQQALIRVVKETGLIQANLQNFLVIVEMLFLSLPSIFVFHPIHFVPYILPVVQPESSSY